MTRFMNHTKSMLLLATMFGLIIALGYMLGGTGGLVLAFVFGGAMNIAAFFYSDKIAISAMRGRQVDASSAPDLYEMVERLARRADLPMPRVYVCPQEAPNAFATGRSPKHAAVAVTQGALRLLSYEELEGVMAHELAHVKNRDTLISTIAATIAGAINALGWFAMFGMGSRDGVHPLIAILMIFLAPVAAAIVQMAISRSREYVADADGAAIAGSPDGLINALRKLEQYAKGAPLHNGQLDAANHMFIVEPFTGESFAKLFSTHPSTSDRIARLRESA
jgi:heat shock protein HtpX